MNKKIIYLNDLYLLFKKNSKKLSVLCIDIECKDCKKILPLPFNNKTSEKCAIEKFNYMKINRMLQKWEKGIE